MRLPERGLRRLHFGRRFVLWHALRWGFRGAAWHSLVTVVVVAAVVGLVVYLRRRR